MGFEWDQAKDAANRRKHGLGFREAAQIFRGPVLVATDTRHDYGERRGIMAQPPQENQPPSP